MTDDFATWIDARLADAGIRRRGALVPVRSWDRAELLTFDTDRGRMWAKAVPEVFVHEIAVTILLADIDPGCVPPVVAADTTLGRIITEHVDGPSLATVPDRQDAWAATLSRLAEVQRVVAAEPGALATAGVAPASIRGLAEAVPHLIGDDDVLGTGSSEGLSRSEVTALRARTPGLVDACHALADSGVPDSLEHGDLTADEVILGEMGPVFLDWSDGSVTHPFLSAASLLADGVAGDDGRAAYLGPWLAAGIVTEAAGRAAIANAATVLPLHLAALYADRILPALGGGSNTDPKVIRALRTLIPG
ncbi:MAG TPA: phosphotransferase [Candidatus Limnocylindrales bacterium]